jgi:hypothetical protein
MHAQEPKAAYPPVSFRWRSFCLCFSLSFLKKNYLEADTGMLDIGSHDKLQFRNAIDAASCLQSHAREISLGQLAASFIDRYAAGTSNLIKSRMPDLQRVLTMAQDTSWKLPKTDRERIYGTFQYLLKRAAGSLSDIEASLLHAGAIDLMLHDCGAEMNLYEEFLQFRASSGEEKDREIFNRTDWLQYKREGLQQRRKCPLLASRGKKIS